MLNRLERKIGKYAIPHLSLWIVFSYVMSYVLMFIVPNIVPYFYLSAFYILKGEAWRLITWLLVPPSSLSFWTLFLLLGCYSIGTVLERTWGDFRYNVFILGGILATILGAFVLYGGAYLAAAMHGSVSPITFAYLMGSGFSSYYIYLSILLGFAITYPDMELRFMFILPIKAKYLGIFEVVWLAYSMGAGTWEIRVSIISSLLNVLVFFLATRNYRKISPKQMRRQKAYQNQTKPFKTVVPPPMRADVQRSGPVTKHKCAICGRTELAGDELEFRFCSKCNGNYEYCQDHLYTHKHKE